MFAGHTASSLPHIRVCIHRYQCVYSSSHLKASKLADPVDTDPDDPGADISLMHDLATSIELIRIQKKIKHILLHWLNYYRSTLGKSWNPLHHDPLLHRPCFTIHVPQSIALWSTFHNPCSTIHAPQSIVLQSSAPQSMLHNLVLYNPRSTIHIPQSIAPQFMLHNPCSTIHCFTTHCSTTHGPHDQLFWFLGKPTFKHLPHWGSKVVGL